MTDKTRKKVLKALLDNSKMSDREISQKIGVSQPTVSRARARLLTDGVIKAYSIVPDLAKLGYTMITVSQLKNNNTDEAALIAFEKKVAADQRVIFALENPRDIVIVAIHKDFNAFTQFETDYRPDTTIHASTAKGILKDMAVRTL